MCAPPCPPPFGSSLKFRVIARKAKKVSEPDWGVKGSFQELMDWMKDAQRTSKALVPGVSMKESCPQVSGANREVYSQCG